MSKMVYTDLEYDEVAILNLYESLSWTNYTNNKKTLFKGIKNSLYCRGAYDNNKLVGLIRVVGDGETIIYIQDILVLESYQRLGIGSNLIKYVVNKYKDVRQICLTTDMAQKQLKFYESMGFKSYLDQKLTGFIYDK